MTESLQSFADRTSEVDALRDANLKLAQQLVQAKARTERLVSAAMQGAQAAITALGPIKPVTPPKADKRTRGAEGALWHLTDWQLSKTTPSYNSEIAQDRVMRFCDKAARITEIQRADHPVKECVIAFGGDMLEGLFNFPTQPFEIDQTLFGQLVTVARLQVDVVRFALSLYDKVTVVAEPGNHGRLGNKSAVIPKSDNADRFAYELARQQLIGEHRLTWDPEHGKEDIQRIEIGNYRALLIHGDEVGRGGFASPGTILQHVNRWKAGAYIVDGAYWDFTDCYVGHFHNHSQQALADGDGAVFWTGSTESENHYARDTMAASGRPSQRLHFIDLEAGRVTAEYRVRVD